MDLDMDNNDVADQGNLQNQGAQTGVSGPPQNPIPPPFAPQPAQQLTSVPILQSPFVVQVPTPNLGNTVQNPVAPAQGSDQTPPQAPQTPPSNGQHTPDPEATPRAPNFGSQSSIPPPQSPIGVPPAAKRRRAPTPSSDNPQPSTSSSNSGYGTSDMLMTQLYDGIRLSNAEYASKQNEQFEKLTSSVQHNSAVLGRVLEKLDGVPTNRSKGKNRQENAGEEERQPGGSGTATVDDANGGDSDAGRNAQPSFSFATKKKGGRSGAVKHRPQDELRDKELMRKWLNEVMGDRDLCENEVSQEEADTFAAKFKKNPLARPCTVENFRYWVAGSPKSAWNKGASYVFVDILEKKKFITKPDPDTCDRIRESFFVRLKTLRGIWLDKQKMQEDQKQQPLVLTKRRQRKYNLFHRRREVIITIPQLEQYLEDFDQLGMGGMSSDEEDSEMEEGTMCYKIKEPYWRGHLLTKWLRLLDYVHLEGRCTVDSEGNSFGFTRGAPPRLRVATNDRTSKSAYVAGLPVNFYDAEWLEKQEPGWAKGGAGFVNQLIRPRNPKKLDFLPDLASRQSLIRKTIPWHGSARKLNPLKVRPTELEMRPALLAYGSMHFSTNRDNYEPRKALTSGLAISLQAQPQAQEEQGIVKAHMDDVKSIWVIFMDQAEKFHYKHVNKGVNLYQEDTVAYIQ
ncbi:hypothetical protein EV360DRAFT_75125 [Lentinula raphanica]|nr:hypothetical protein EV360DRAFT_75125 [Lentinula raphanica]